MPGDDGNNVFPDDHESPEKEPAWLATQDIIDESRSETKRFLWFALIPIALLVVTALVLFYASGDDDGTTTDVAGPSLQSESADGDADADADADDANADADPDDSADADAEDDGATDTEAGTEADDAAAGEDNNEAEAGGGTTPSAIPAPPTDAPYVDATLTDNVFVLSGRVPDEQTKLALETRAEIAYAPFFTSELEVDESIDPAAWLEAAPQVVGLLPMITDGTIRLQDDAIAVAGRSPNPEYAANFEGALSLITGLPFTGSSIEITGLVPPRFVATVTDGTVLLEGEVPSEAIGQTFVQGAAAVYGPENVSSTMTVDNGTYTSFWMYTMPGIFQLFQPFTAYEIQVENGITSGAMQGGVLFDVNSADITEEAGQVLGVGVALLVRDQSLDMTVIGHTDSQGPRDLNQELSLERAQSVVQFLVANGVTEGRLTADGKGPDEPIASNDDEVGRALNRRVEFLFD